MSNQEPSKKHTTGKRTYKDGLKSDYLPRQIFPRAYAIELTEPFRETFCKNPIAKPPSEISKALWLKIEGEPIFKERQREAHALEVKSHEDYQNLVANVELENQSIRRENENRKDAYLRELSEHEKALAAHRRRYGGKRKARLKRRLRNRLSLAIDAQSGLIETILGDIAHRGRRETLRSRSYLFWLSCIVFHLILLVTLPVLSFLPGAVAFVVWYRLLTLHQTRQLMWKKDVGGYGYSRPDSFKAGVTVWTHYQSPKERASNAIYTPVYFLKDGVKAHRTKHELKEHALLCVAEEMPVMSSKSYWLSFFSSLVPGLSVIVIFHCIWKLISRVILIDVTPEARALASKRKERLLDEFKTELKTDWVSSYLERKHKTPTPPKEPMYLIEHRMPLSPAPITAVWPEPPLECYDDGSNGNYEHILRGTRVYTAEENRTLARQMIFANNEIQPYFPFGDIPIAFFDGEGQHILVMGYSGSGKTTTIRHLMSALMPLTSRQKKQRLRQSTDPNKRRPTSSHEWSRSFTHQAVVYNAKNENIPLLEGFGFSTDRDLIILDPSDRRCFAWDIARDINDRDSISQFVEMLLPMSKNPEKNKDTDFWEAQARDILEAVIISLRNAAFAVNEEPSWTFIDLANAVSTPEALRAILAYHDTPAEAIAQFVDLAGPQAHSNFMSATAPIRKFRTAAQRWAEAARQGRIISLKEWAKNGAGQVLVLPNTKANPRVNEPLNRAFFKLLTNLVITHEYSEITDETGQKSILKRLFIVDEVGHAGNIPDLQRLMTEGRAFGAVVFLGVHQLSQMEETYGKEATATILGLCPYAVVLKSSDPETLDYECKRLGENLRAYDKPSFTIGTTTGKTSGQTESHAVGQVTGTQESTTTGETEGTTDTHGRSSSNTNSLRGGSSTSASTHDSTAKSRSKTNQHTTGTTHQDSVTTTTGTSLAFTEQSNQSRTDTKDLRKEFAVYQSEIANLPDPATTKMICGYYIVPSLPPWRADIPISSLAPELEFPTALMKVPKTLKWENDEKVSRAKSWDSADYKRLFLDEQTFQKKKNRKARDDDQDEELSADFDW